MIQLFEFKVNTSGKKSFLLFGNLSRKYLAVCHLMSSINPCAQVSFITFVMAVFCFVLLRMSLPANVRDKNQGQAWTKCLEVFLIDFNIYQFLK